MRLTRKLEDNYEFNDLNHDLFYKGNPYDILTPLHKCLNKLGQLEDIEEVCKKLVSQPIYEKYVDTHEIHKEDYTECRALYSFEDNRIELYLWDFVMCFELDQYGKTWAFTKEELE